MPYYFAIWSGLARALYSHLCAQVLTAYYPAPTPRLRRLTASLGLDTAQDACTLGSSPDESDAVSVRVQCRHVRPSSMSLKQRSSAVADLSHAAAAVRPCVSSSTTSHATRLPLPNLACSCRASVDQLVTMLCPSDPNWKFPMTAQDVFLRLGCHASVMEDPVPSPALPMVWSRPLLGSDFHSGLRAGVTMLCYPMF